MTDEREAILDALGAWIRQRPGLDPRNYISGWQDSAGRSAYFSEARSITRDLHQARELLNAVARHPSIGAAELKKAFRAFSGRLQWDGKALSYCTGQYWPTEYRAAACAVLASALWDWLRDQCGCETGDDIRRGARRELSRGVARRWFI